MADLKKFLITVIAVCLVSTLFSWITCGWLFTWVYAVPPLIWKSSEEIVTNMTWMTLINFLTSIIFVGIYCLLQKAIPGTGAVKGLTYGAIVWAVAALSGLPSFLFVMTIAPIVIFYWIIAFLVKYLLLGLVTALIYK